VAFATSTGIGTAKIKALLKPKPLQELRESSSKFFYLDSVSAASGIKISGSGLDDALPGSLVISTERAGYESEIQSEIREIFSSDKSGVILKADTIGSIEAISRLLKSAGVSVSKKEVGNITKRDVLDAFAMRSVDPYGAVVLAFSVKADSDAETEAYATGVRIISGNIIYKLIDDYKEWAEQERKSEKLMLEKALTFPGELKVLPNSCFRISHPAIFGVEVMHGRIKPDVRLMNERGEILGRIKEIQDNGTGMAEAKKGANVAISIEEITFGRHVKESDLLYVFLNDENERALRYKFMDLIDDDERSLLEKTSIVKQSAKKKE
jgi:translation initiation factor 5B